MTNLPQWTRTAATTPRLKRKFVVSNTAHTTPNTHHVEAEGDKERFIGAIVKDRRNSFAWEAWTTARKLDDKRPYKAAATGRSRTLLAAISRVRLEFASYHARKDAKKTPKGAK